MTIDEFNDWCMSHDEITDCDNNVHFNKCCMETHLIVRMRINDKRYFHMISKYGDHRSNLDKLIQHAKDNITEHLDKLS